MVPPPAPPQLSTPSYHVTNPTVSSGGVAAFPGTTAMQSSSPPLDGIVSTSPQPLQPHEEKAPPASPFQKEEAMSCPPTTAEDITTTTHGEGVVGIFWDYQTVQIPTWWSDSVEKLPARIRAKVLGHCDGRIVEQRLYYDSQQPLPPPLELNHSSMGDGFTLVDDSFDEKLIVDVLSFAWQQTTTNNNSTASNKKVCVVLIAADGDYSYTLARLRDLGVFSVVIYKAPTTSTDYGRAFFENANVVLSWEDNVLGGGPPPPPVPPLPVPPTPTTHPNHTRGGSVETTTTTSSTRVTPAVASSSFVTPPTVAVTVPTTVPAANLLPVVLPRGGSSGDGGEKLPRPEEATVNRPDILVVVGLVQELPIYKRRKLLAFCKVLLEPKNQLSGRWVQIGLIAEIFYKEVGKKDGECYHEMRSRADSMGLLEWGKKLKNQDRVTKFMEGENRTGPFGKYIRFNKLGLAVVPTLQNFANYEDQNLDASALASGLYHSSSTITSSHKKRRHHPGSDGGTTTKKRTKTSIPEDRPPNVSTATTGVVPDRRDGMLYVDGLTPRTTRKCLQSYFQQYGPLKRVFRAKTDNHEWGRIEFVQAQDAQRALFVKGRHVIDHQTIQVRPWAGTMLH